MDSDKILQQLNSRFAAPLPEFYKRRIVVWHDEDREFADMVAEMQLTNARIAVLTENNNFSVKKLLCHDDTKSNFLLYCPVAYSSLGDNWLLDMEYYAEQFTADRISMWMDEMNIAQTPGLRNTVKQLRKFFSSKERRKLVASQKTLPATPPQLLLAAMAAVAGVRNPNPAAIIKSVLANGIDTPANPVCQDFAAYGMDDSFWRMASQGTGYRGEPDVGSLAVHILLTAATRNIRSPEFFSGLESCVSTPHQLFCCDLLSDWLHSDDKQQLRQIAEYVEEKLSLSNRFMKLDVESLANCEIFPGADVAILLQLIREIADHTAHVQSLSSTVAKRRTAPWYGDVKWFYEAIMQWANMQRFRSEHADGFHIVEPEKLWQNYTREYYTMDAYYRRFHLCRGEILKNYHDDLSEPFNAVVEEVEGLYVNWFLTELGASWANACADDMRDLGRIPTIPQQTSFYRSKISDSDARMYVIISDALRYDVAASLTEQLRRETQCQVTLNSMEGIFPTITKFGMAALLPHGKLSVEMRQGKNDRLAVLADGQSTEAGSRDKILKSANPRSAALKYRDIIGMKRTDRQSLVKAMDVVYIYHDTIDEAGHIDKSIFAACEESIAELKNLVRIITNEFSGTNIIITADHGFLYTYKPLTVDSKLDKTEECEQSAETGRRYAIMEKGANPPYLLPVRFLDDTTCYTAFAPRENIRIKIKGGGMNFVHGGISLQEMVVPVVEYHFLRNDSREYRSNRSKYDTRPVTLSLLSAQRKISNMVFSLSFYQKDAVSSNRQEAEYQLHFTDSAGKAVSDTVSIIADKTSADISQRTFRCTFSLKPMKYSSTEAYYLIIGDKNGTETSRDEFRIDIAFAPDDFDFFT